MRTHYLGIVAVASLMLNASIPHPAVADDTLDQMKHRQGLILNNAQAADHRKNQVAAVQKAVREKVPHYAEQAYLYMRQGVSFDDLRKGSSNINPMARITSVKYNGQFIVSRVVGDDLPLATMLPSGFPHGPLDLDLHVKDSYVPLDDNGNPAEECKVVARITAFGDDCGHDNGVLGYYSCSAILDDSAVKQVTADFATWVKIHFNDDYAVNHDTGEGHWSCGSMR